MSYTVTFRDTETGDCTQLVLYSHYTCLYGKNSGEGKSHFISYVSEQINLGKIEVEVSDPTIKFTFADYSSINAILTNTERYVIMIDEYAMLRDDIIKKVNKSKHLFICVTRAMPLKMDYSMTGMYRIERYEDKGNLNFEIRELDQLPLAKDFSKEFKTVVVEAEENRSEHQLLSEYLPNVVPANGRDKIEKELRRSKDDILIFADLSNIGRAYSILNKRCSQNPNIVFYNYMSFEQLLHHSKLVMSYAKPVELDVFDCLSIEQYYEKILEKETKDTPIEYKHGLPLAEPYISKDNFQVVFDSKIAKGIKGYIEKFGNVTKDND